MKKMKWERILVSLSTLVIVAHGEDETCGSQDNQKKCTKTVNSHLKKTLRSLWSEEILIEQTNQMKAIFDEMKDQVIDQLTSTVNDMKKDFQVRIGI